MHITYKTISEVETLVQGFVLGNLPRSQWTHQAHLTVGAWYLIHYPEAEATQHIREGIQRYNQAQGIKTTPTSGYHETMTIFWIRIICEQLRLCRDINSNLDKINNLIDHLSDQHLPLQYYTQGLLMSGEARLAWVEPDLQSIMSA